MCVCEDSEQGFSALFWLLFHMGKKKVEQVLSSPKPVHRSCVQKKAAKKSRPQLPSPSASFRRFSSLHSVPRPPPFQTHPPLYSSTFLADVNHFDASCLLICPSQEKEKNSPLQCHLPLLYLSVFVVWRNQELPQIMLCFNDT